MAHVLLKKSLDTFSSVTESYQLVPKCCIDIGDVLQCTSTGHIKYTKMSQSTLHVQTVRQLIEQGADVNRLSRDGMSPLAVAAFWGYYDIADELLRAG